ncbi:MAG: hypothetical protein WA629_02115, partial [Candidatus Aquilonibacter sp.]
MQRLSIWAAFIVALAACANRTPSTHTELATTAAATPTPIRVAEHTPTPAATATPMPRPSQTPTPRPSQTPAPQSSQTPTPEASRTPTPEPLQMPVRAPSQTPPPTPSQDVLRAAPNAAPRIVAVHIDKQTVRSGETISGTVETSSNVASVEARIAAFSISVPKVGV